MTDWFRGMASAAVGAGVGLAIAAAYRENYDHAIYALSFAILATWLRAILGPMGGTTT